MRHALLAWIVSLLWACNQSGPAPDTRTRDCDFGEPRTVFAYPGLRYHALDLSRGNDARALAVWSHADGLHTRLLDLRGHPQAAPLRVDDGCPGGLDALPHPDGGHVLACSRPGSPGELAWLRLDARGRRTHARPLGPAGRDSQGVEIAAHAEGWSVAWHDGSPGAYQIRYVHVGLDGSAQPPQPLSDPAYAASSPSLTVHEGRWIGAWTETRFLPDGQAATRLIVARQGETPQILGEPSVLEAAPHLAAHADPPWLLFRDRVRSGQRAQAYAWPLSTGELAPQGTPHRVGRANSEGAPRALACGKRRFALLPRIYGGELYIGVHALDAALDNLGDGHQYYANSREFVLAAGACTPDGMLMLTAERAPPSRPGVRLVAIPYDCPAP